MVPIGFVSDGSAYWHFDFAVHSAAYIAASRTEHHAAQRIDVTAFSPIAPFVHFACFVSGGVVKSAAINA
jgi:hypothetical protein